jgi:pimeloyl-ACP methyl ester carboxylesterase
VQQVALPPIPNSYRVLIVGGLLNTCIPKAPAYKEGQEYLRQQYGLDIEFLSVPNDSCEDNTPEISDFLKKKMKGDARKFIVIGYSKGAPDVQVALARKPDAAKAVAAFISVAGAVGGSPVANLIPGMAKKWIDKYNLKSCKGDLTAGFKSLSQSTRRAFLSKYPDPAVPTYSLPAISNKANTSQLLAQTWQIMSAYSDKVDGQLTVEDATVPRSKTLGAALADHFAVAVPFETSDEPLKAGADKNHYPRSALLEAMVRFVIQDLESQK